MIYFDSHVKRAAPISINLDFDFEERLRQLALDTNRSMSFYARELINKGLEDLKTNTALRGCQHESAAVKKKFIQWKRSRYS